MRVVYPDLLATEKPDNHIYKLLTDALERKEIIILILKCCILTILFFTWQLPIPTAESISTWTNFIGLMVPKKIVVADATILCQANETRRLC